MAAMAQWIRLYLPFCTPEFEAQHFSIYKAKIDTLFALQFVKKENKQKYFLAIRFNNVKTSMVNYQRTWCSGTKGLFMRL